MIYAREILYTSRLSTLVLWTSLIQDCEWLLFLGTGVGCTSGILYAGLRQIACVWSVDCCRLSMVLRWTSADVVYEQTALFLSVGCCWILTKSLFLFVWGFSWDCSLNLLIFYVSFSFFLLPRKRIVIKVLVSWWCTDRLVLLTYAEVDELTMEYGLIPSLRVDVMVSITQKKRP